ncbi:MAG: hypothetical protein ACJ8R9_33700 [Steroidobacteraceae bacterium]
MTRITLRRFGLVGLVLLQGCPLLTLGDAPQKADAAEKRDLAVAQARETLRTAGVDPSPLTVASVQPVTWRDSSLGCRQPGIQYLQVLTPGYKIELHGAQGNYVVHVAGNQAIVCTGKSGAGSRLTRPLVPMRGMELMTQRARQMLAAAVHAPEEQINVAGFEPQVWPDTGLGCPAPNQSVAGRVSGFKIRLEHGGREYTFNTDLHRVIACPAIEAE